MIKRSGIRGSASLHGFESLEAELVRWESPPAFWWRDDDAFEETDQFRRMLDWSGQHSLPGLLGVISGKAAPELAVVLSRYPHLRAAAHGWLHKNHEPPRRPKNEFGPARSGDQILGSLRQSFETMEQLFGPASLPVLIAPWNRFHDAYLPLLEAAGFAGLSRRGRPSRRIGALTCVDVGFDMMLYDPHGRPTPRSRTKTANKLASKLAEYRTAHASTDNPIGILTHHNDVWVEERWSTFSALVEVTRRHGCTWLDPTVVFCRQSSAQAPVAGGRPTQASSAARMRFRASIRKYKELWTRRVSSRT